MPRALGRRRRSGSFGVVVSIALGTDVGFVWIREGSGSFVRTEYQGLLRGLGSFGRGELGFVRTRRGSGSFGYRADSLALGTIGSRSGRHCTCADHGALLSWMFAGKAAMPPLETRSVADHRNFLNTGELTLLADAAPAVRAY